MSHGLGALDGVTSGEFSPELCPALPKKPLEVIFVVTELCVDHTCWLVATEFSEIAPSPQPIK